MKLLREVDNSEKTYEDLKDLSYRFNRKTIYKEEDPIELPVEIKNNSNWTVLDNPERLQRIFNFDNYREVLYFFEEVYKYQFDINHHCKIIINHLEVNVETYTHGFEGITVLDKKITKFSDDLYGDVQYFKNKK